MPFQYQLDKNLNRKKAFQYTPPSEIDLSAVTTPDSWVEKLAKYSAITINIWIWLYLRHIGETSSYNPLQALKEQLLFIYCRVTERLDKQLGELSNNN